jgi:hypothetical protein
MKNVLTAVEFQLVIPQTAAGQATTNGAEVDMAGFDGVAFVLIVGTITTTGTVTMHVEECILTGFGTPIDIVGTAILVTQSTQSNMIAVTEIIQPQHRFVRPVVVTAGGANSVLGGVLAIKYQAKSMPTVQGATVAASEIHLSPAAGTP